MKAVGIIVAQPSDSRKNTQPAAMVFQRLATHQRSSDR
jgi:hypothetical protein